MSPVTTVGELRELLDGLPPWAPLEVGIHAETQVCRCGSPGCPPCSEDAPAVFKGKGHAYGSTFGHRVLLNITDRKAR